MPFAIPNTLTGLIIGKNGDTIKQLHNKCGAYLFIPKQYDTTTNERILELSGSEEQIDKAKREIRKLLSNAHFVKGSDDNTSDSTYNSDTHHARERESGMIKAPEVYNEAISGAHNEEQILKYMETLYKNKDIILKNN